MRMCAVLLLALAGRTGAATSRTAIAQSLWDPASLHLFVDQTGLTSVTGLSLKAHRPVKTYELAVHPSEPWDGGGAQIAAPAAASQGLNPPRGLNAQVRARARYSILRT